MAVLARVHITSQQRIDLPQLLGIESYTAFDFRALIQSFVGSSQPYIVRGFEITGKTGLFLSVSIADCFVFNPLDENGSFYLGDIDASDILVELPPSQPFVYLEARFSSSTSGAISASYWDPLAVTGSSEGSEFTATQNSQNAIMMELSVNTVGFSSDAIPICIGTTSNSAVSTTSDARPLLFRLGTGGASPNAGYKFPWSPNRGEPVSTGTGTGNDALSPFRAVDNTGILNDKGIRSFKEMFDAICTRVSEISGSSIWYSSSAIQQYVGGLSLSSIFFDTVGHTLQPNRNFVYSWSGTALSNTGTEAGAWRAGYCDLEWQLGNTFTSASDRSYSSVAFSVAIADGYNAYLLLEREVLKNANNNLFWKSASATIYTDFTTNSDYVVSGVTGDFAGIAVGDYIRKASQGTSQYYRIVALATPTALFSDVTGIVADNSVVAVRLAKIIDTTASEPLRFFRSRYSSADLVALSPTSTTTLTVDYYWLARRRGDFIWLRDYGPMFKNKNWEHIDRAWSKIKVLKEYENLFFSGGGNVSWDLTPNALAWSSDFIIEIAGRGTLLSPVVYTIPAGSVTLADGQCFYVDIPETEVSSSLTPVICAIGDVPLDPADALHTGRTYVLFHRHGTKVLGLGEAPDLDSGETGTIGWDLPISIRTRLGILSETTFQAYGSTTQIDSADDYATAIGKLDAAIYNNWNQENQDRTSKLVRGGFWTWNSTAGTLVNDAAAYIQIPGLAENRNTIAAQTITLSSDGDVAYVDINRTGSGALTLTVTVAAVGSVSVTSPTGNNRVIIARRIGTYCLVGTCLFTSSESKLLDREMCIVAATTPYQSAVTAPKGTRLLDTSSSVPQFYIKQDAGSTTNWKPLDWTTLINTYSGHASTSGISLYFSGANQQTVNIAGTRTFYIQGRPFYTTTTDSATMSGSAGPRYFYYDSTGVLQQSLSLFSFITHAPCAVAYWTGTAGHSLGWEFHGLTDADDHTWKHLTVGTRYISGLQQTSTPLPSGNPASDINSYIWLTGGDLLDEDIRISITSTVTPTTKWQQNLGSGLTSADAAILPLIYITGGGVGTYVPPDANRFPFYHGGGTTFPYYDNAGTLTTATNGDFIVYWVFGTSTVVVSDLTFTNAGTAVYIRPHNARFTTLTDAAASSFSTLVWTGLPLQENKALYRIIFQCSTGYTSATHRCKIVQVDDFRLASPVPVGASSASSHLLLSDLNGGVYGDGNHTNLVTRKISASTNPSVTDDILAYKELSFWLNQTNDEVWVCKDNSAGAANWKQVILDGGTAAIATMSIGSTTAQIMNLLYNSATRLALNSTGTDASATFKIVDDLSSTVTSISSTPVTLATYYAEISAAYAADCVVNLPSASSANIGKEYRLKKLNSTAYTVTLTPNGADTIEGRTSLVFNGTDEVYHLKAFNGGWRLL